VAVSWVFLALSVWGAVWTWVAFHPPRRPAWFMFASFFGAWLTTELAPLHVLWQFAAVMIFIALGALQSWPGWLALAITFVSWGFLSVKVRGARKTDAVFGAALADALPVQIDPVATPRQWDRIMFPFRIRRRGVRRVRDIQYVDGDKLRRHRLDVYAPSDVQPGAPVLLQIHGGGWMIGDKREQGLPLMYYLATRGWVCVAINYRLSPRATWPDHLVDCKRALAWIRAHIVEYSGDPSFVVVTGGSAGGHLAAMMGLTANDPEFQPGFEDVDTTVQGMVPFYGVFDWTRRDDGKRDNGLRDILRRYIVKQPYADAPEAYERASPLYRVVPDAPPALVVHGDLDTLAPVTDARAFVAKLRNVSKSPVVYAELHGAHHAFELFNSIRTMQAITGVDAFLEWLRRTTPSLAAAPPQSAAAPSGNAAPDGSANGRRSTAHTAQ
jgi:acetyl esterase/lipase